MIELPNTVTATPDYVLGIDDGQVVRVPVGMNLKGDTRTATRGLVVGTVSSGADNGGSGGGAASQVVEDVTGTTYTFVDADNGKLKRFTHASGCLATLPANVLSFTASTAWQSKCYVEVGAGNLTLQGDGVSAVTSKTGTLITNGTKSEVLIEQTQLNVFVASGDLGALASTDISDFTEAAQDAVAAAFAAGSHTNMTVTYNDASNSISLNASGGSRASHTESGSFANYPITGGAGTNTSGVHSGAFSALDSSVGAAATTNLSTIGWKRRQQYTSQAAATNRGAGIRSSTTGVAWAPDTGNTEALRFEAVFGSADAITSCRGAVGLGWFAGSSPSMSAEPSTFTNCMMAYYDSTDTQIKIGINDGSGSITPVATSASFPCNGNETDLYKVTFKFSGGSSRQIDWAITNLVSGATLSGSVTTDLPAVDNQLMAFAYRNSAGNASTVVFNYGGMFGGAFTALA